jgi:hypothetical protein
MELNKLFLEHIRVSMSCDKSLPGKDDIVDAATGTSLVHVAARAARVSGAVRHLKMGCLSF